jgi:hypothetical protein
MYELSPLSSLHLRTFVSLCEGAGFGYQGAAAASLLDNMVGRNPFEEGQVGFDVVRREFQSSIPPALPLTNSDLCMLTLMFGQLWLSGTELRNELGKRWNLRPFFIRNALATYTSICDIRKWTDASGDIVALADRMDDLMFQSAPELVSHLSSVKPDWHQTGSGRYVKNHIAAQTSCTVLPLDTQGETCSVVYGRYTSLQNGAGYIGFIFEARSVQQRSYSSYHWTFEGLGFHRSRDLY